MEPCKVEELWRFPVKSMGGERLEHLEFDVDGVVGDRRFAVRDSETGLIASAKRPGRWGVLLVSGDDRFQRRRRTSVELRTGKK